MALPQPSAGTTRGPMGEGGNRRRMRARVDESDPRWGPQGGGAGGQLSVLGALALTDLNYGNDGGGLRITNTRRVPLLASMRPRSPFCWGASSSSDKPPAVFSTRPALLIHTVQPVLPSSSPPEARFVIYVGFPPCLAHCEI